MNQEMQKRVGAWALKCFGERVATNCAERATRVAEEAIELAQACGIAHGTLAALASRVYDRPTGRVVQEVGEVGITLAAFGCAAGIDVDRATAIELARIDDPDTIELIRRGHSEKVRLGLATPCNGGTP